MIREDALRLANEWITAWNTHDLERILSHYSDDVAFSSPLIPKIAGETSGKLHGKTALRDYFHAGLQAYPDLRFELLSIFTGVDSLTLQYRSVGERVAAEVMFFGPDSRITQVFAHYDKD
jgi:hypothetical protein